LKRADLIKAAIAYAKRSQEEGVLEVDDNPKVSRAPGRPNPEDGTGTYVQAWIWVPDSDLETP
jgi:hypothetical protein